MSLFADLEGSAMAEIERVFAEGFDFMPYAAAPGGGRRSPDDTRQALQDIRAVLDTDEFKSTEFGSEARGSIPAVMSRIAIYVDERWFPLGERPQRFDRFRRRKNGNLYEAGTPQMDAEGVWKVPVTELGREA